MKTLLKRPCGPREAELAMLDPRCVSLLFIGTAPGVTLFVSLGPDQAEDNQVFMIIITPTSPIPAAVYTRRPPKPHPNSIRKQLGIIREYARRHGMQIIKEYADSTAKPAPRRSTKI
jgi:hypothetical protein